MQDKPPEPTPGQSTELPPIDLTVASQRQYSEFGEPELRHLDTIQTVITRLETNTFHIKAIAGTSVAAVLAYAGAIENPSKWLAAAGMVPAVVFWFLDAQYLRLGRLFRMLLDGVRRGEVTEPFDMNFTRYNKIVAAVILIAFSWSVMWFYLTLIIVMGVLALVI